MLPPMRIQVDIGKWKFQAVLCHETHLEEDAEELDETRTELDGRLDVHLAFAGEEPPYFGFAPIPAPYEDEE